MTVIKVPEGEPRPIKGPYRHACWAMKPGVFIGGRCMFVKDHEGPHQWEWAEQIVAKAVAEGPNAD